MLRLRRATVVEVPDATRGGGHAPPGPELGDGEQLLLVELDGPGEDARPVPAVADVGLVGRSETGDSVIVNVEALDRGLGSGGFHVVHVNLTRGLDARPGGPAEAMKLNYTSLQHGVEPVDGERPELPLARPVAILALHGQLAPLAWAFAQALPGGRLGYVQTEGGALSGARSRTVSLLRDERMLAGHITASASFGGALEAVTVIGAIAHGIGRLGWDAAVCGPGPGIVGSGTALGHGGMAALDSAHAALALGCPALLVPRMSCGEERSRHRGLSHHTLTVLDLLLEPVTVALPAGARPPAGLDRHDCRRARVDLPAYAASGLPATTMGRTILEDPLFFAAALAGGGVLGQLAGEGAGIAEPVSGRSGA